MFDLDHLSALITAIGALGTAAFGLVESTKVFWGGANHLGFAGIRAAARRLLPSAGAGVALAPDAVIATLQANWFNGTDLASQKDIAKTLIKLNLHADNAQQLAGLTGVDPAMLQQVAGKIATGEGLDAREAELFARFDLIVTALLDEAYQRADQRYRNGTRALATLFAVALAIAAGVITHRDLGGSVLVGLLATPLAPIAKDLTTALATAVNALQVAKK